MNEDNIIYVGTTCAKVAGKVGLNMMFPGFGAAIDFGEAIKDLYDENYVGAGVNFCSGVFEIFSCGLWGYLKNAAKPIGKTAATSSVKATVKEANKLINYQVATNLAKGAPREATIYAGILAREKVKKEIGKKYSIDLAKGMIGETVERAAYGVAKSELNKAVNHATFEGIIEGAFTELAEELLKIGPKETFKSTYASASKQAATEYLKKHNAKLLMASATKTVVVERLKHKQNC